MLVPSSSSSSSSAIDSRAGQIFSRLMPQNQPSSRVPLPSPTAWSPDQHLAAMLADVCLPILDRTEGRGLGFGQLVRTHTGKCLKCQSTSEGHSDHNAPCAGGRLWSAGPAPGSKLGQGVPGIHRFLSSSLHCTGSGEVSWPFSRWQGSVSDASAKNRTLETISLLTLMPQGPCVSKAT